MLLNQIFKWATPWVQSLIKADPTFLMHVLEQKASYLHLICLVALNDETGQIGALTPSQKVVWLRTRQKDILEKIYPELYRAVWNAIRKLPCSVQPGAFYKTLIELVRDPDNAELIRHHESITPNLLEQITNTPKYLRHPCVFRLAKDRRDINVIAYELKVLEVLRPELNMGQRLAALRNTSQDNHIEWFLRQLLKCAFPNPPVQTADWLKPVTSYAELKSIAKAYRLCVPDYVFPILRGDVYFYRCEEPTVVVLSLIKDKFLGWMIDKMVAPGNEHVEEKTETRILDEFLRHGIEPRPPLDGLHRQLEFHIEMFEFDDCEI